MADENFRFAITDSGTNGYTNRILIGTPTTGTVRIEWVQSRYGQIIPVNWSSVQQLEYINSFIPLRYQVADAQNLIVQEAVEKDYEWTLLWEHDTMAPPNATILLNEYMISKEVPVISGLYYTRSRPSQPLVFRGTGNSYYEDFKLGDMVWADGVPTGFLLIHNSILKVMWNESPEYLITYGNTVRKTRRVFESPAGLWYDPETGSFNTLIGTSDLEWCKRIMRDNIFEKAGWPEYKDKEHPFLVDTRIFCKHINPNGEQFP